jgi:hypothetical protein
MRRLLLLSAIAGSLCLAPTVSADDDCDDQGDNDGDSKAVSTLAVYGDAPYGTTPKDTAEFDLTPSFITAVNADAKIDLVLHVGDIHSGKQYCTKAYDQSIYDLWTAFKKPLIYTPGDNEWTDCNKAGEGGGTYNKATSQIDYVLGADNNPVDYANGDPIANLDLIRSIFFSKPGHALGGGHKFVLSQAVAFDFAHPSDQKYVENVIFIQSDVLFVTLNLPGGSNNDTDVWYGAPVASAAQTQEVDERTGADLRWLDRAFAFAKLLKVKGLVIQTQADMWDPEKGAAHQAGYEPFVKSIADHTVAFKKPVLLLNGDSHVYLSDNPFDAANPINFIHPGYTVPNFHRIVVHGSTLPLEYLRLTVDPKANAPQGANAFGPFGWERVQP